MTDWDKDTIKLVQNLNNKLKIDHSKWHNPAEISSADRIYLFPLSLCHLE